VWRRRAKAAAEKFGLHPSRIRCRNHQHKRVLGLNLFSAAILAGGQARRLGGRDKSALVVGAASILERQLTVLRAITPHILIVGGDPSYEQIAGVPVVADRVAGAGALGGLYSALVEAPTEQVLVIACDMPFLTAPFLSRLAALGADAEAAVPRDADGPHPLCASYQRGAAGRLKIRIDAGALRIIDALADLAVREMGPDEVASFNENGRLLLNVNTPDDYRRAQALE
jgi:molybdopterin-guanine dinucleotide biosynthesis protein A